MNRKIADKDLSEASETALSPMVENRRTGRRRFIGGAGATIPVILTLASRSTLAGTCLSPSAKASISHTSHKPNDGATCSGKSPGYWSGGKLNRHDTPAIYKPENSADLNIAKGNRFDSKFFGGPSGTMMEIAALTGNSVFAAHIAAAWCNWFSGKVPSSILNDSDILLMWQLGPSFSYQPISGSSTVLWGKDLIQQYIKSTYA